MRIAFFGTGEFAIPTLRRLEKDIVVVVTTPPRPKGRGQKITPSPVEKVARELGLVIFTPENPNSESAIALLRQYSPDCGVLVDYGFILKEPLLKIPRYGFINLHPSLLPKYRGAAPIPRQIIDGCSESGVTVISVDTKVDAGAILNQLSVPIDPDETAGELSAKLAQLGAQLVLTTLTQIEAGSVHLKPQDDSRATKAPRLTFEDRVINWQHPAAEIHNRIRALSPQPGAFTTFRGKQILILRSKLLQSLPTPMGRMPGEIITELPGVVVATGEGLLELLKVKPAGGKLITGKEFRNGYRISPKERFAE